MALRHFLSKKNLPYFIRTHIINSSINANQGEQVKYYDKCNFYIIYS